jgi:hypothetical protein
VSFHLVFAARNIAGAPKAFWLRGRERSLADPEGEIAIALTGEVDDWRTIIEIGSSRPIEPGELFTFEGHMPYDGERNLRWYMLPLDRHAWAVEKFQINGVERHIQTTLL